MASNPANLHGSGEDLEVECGGTVGDEYKNGVWTSRPENYPPPSPAEILARKVAKAKERAALIDARANEPDPEVCTELQRLLVELEATVIEVERP